MITIQQRMYLVTMKHERVTLLSDPLDRKTKKPIEPHLDASFYVYRKQQVAHQTYYELRRTSSTEPIGWVEEDELFKQLIFVLPTETTAFTINGTGMCYAHPSGAAFDQLYPALYQFKGQPFHALTTWQVGKKIWHLGKIGNTSAWVENIHLVTTR